jgi:hypothetical protein
MFVIMSWFVTTSHTVGMWDCLFHLNIYHGNRRIDYIKQIQIMRRNNIESMRIKLM